MGSHHPRLSVRCGIGREIARGASPGSRQASRSVCEAHGSSTLDLRMKPRVGTEELPRYGAEGRTAARLAAGSKEGRAGPRPNPRWIGGYRALLPLDTSLSTHPTPAAFFFLKEDLLLFVLVFLVFSPSFCPSWVFLYIYNIYRKRERGFYIYNFAFCFG